MGAGLANRLRAFSRVERVSPFTVMLSAYAVLLARLSGAADFLVGDPISMRDRPEFESTFGMLVNTVPIRVRLTGNPTFREILRRVHGELLEVFEHRLTPLVSIIREVNAPRDDSRPPLIQVVINWKERATLLQSLHLGPVTATPLPVHSGHVKFELALAVSDLGDDLRVDLDHHVCIADAATASRWLAGIRRVLEAALPNADRTLGYLQNEVEP